MNFAPWSSYPYEWRAIQNERHRRGTLASRKVLGHGESTLPPSPQPKDSVFFEDLPSLPSTDLGLNSISPQHQSPLLCLPTELRVDIWTYVLVGNDVTIVRKMDKLSHTVLPRDSHRWREAYRGRTTRTGWPLGVEKRVEMEYILAEVDLLALLRTCKRIYLEALPQLYNQESFNFETLEAFYRFLVLSPIVGLQAISSIRISWPGFAYWEVYKAQHYEPRLEHNESWQDICEVIVSMKNLKKLCFVLTTTFYFDSYLDSSPEVIYQIVSPLKGLSEGAAFKLSILGTDVNRNI